MSANIFSFPISMLGVLISLNAMPALAAGANAAFHLPLSPDEVAQRRRAVREELMLPSLSGIRGIAYRVVGFKDDRPLEKYMAGKLEQLAITKIPLAKADGFYKDCDAVVQITFSKAGAHTIAELKVTQFVNLVRNPRIKVRAVTYSDKVYSVGLKPEQAIEQLCNEFVVDFLKANQKGFDPEKGSKEPSGRNSKAAPGEKNRPASLRQAEKK